MHYLVTCHPLEPDITQESPEYIQYVYRRFHKRKAQRFRELSPSPIQVEDPPKEARDYTNIQVYSINQGGSTERLRKKIEESQKRRLFKEKWARLNPD